MDTATDKQVDPNEALTELRKLLRYAGHGGLTENETERADELFQVLTTWINAARPDLPTPT